MQCFVLNTANTLRERFAIVRDKAVYLLYRDPDSNNLETVKVEKLTGAHAMICDPALKSSITM